MDAHDALQPWHTDRADCRASDDAKKSDGQRLAEMTDAEYEALDLYPDE